ncbi:hypothetical protein FKR81_00060 [Lentzea tibetensis]|uniref:Ricin B lectin domain-containing protein n=1 Tax=Lentzea tibetensis TaxID=2591470 RepID=A0A563F208_9PSEU|nr:RICIN domain-containing protein [Lentzea tibetensis]TWP54007.1 hypothetical protein FKR81_00060 [Lentzea tibetensis]
MTSKPTRLPEPAGRATRALYLALGVVMAAVFAVPSPAQAAAAETYRSAQTGNCLDGNTGGDIYPHVCNGGPFQTWEVTVNGDSSRTFKNVATGLCLDGNGSGSVYGHACNGGNFQRWFISLAFGELGFEGKQTGRCLRDVGADITSHDRGVRTCAAARTDQRWN